jgi:hypothetical protein
MHHYQQKYDDLRLKYPVFVFEAFDYNLQESRLIATYKFALGDSITFQPSIEIQVPDTGQQFALEDSILRNMVFHMGMIELISYWKCACPPNVIIKTALLSEKQIEWWKKLYFNGLGEFFYLNGIQASSNDFMHIRCDSDTIFTASNLELNQEYIVPIGGGKDSVVTLELLKLTGYTCIPFIINPRGATLSCIETAGYQINQILSMKRTIDPELLRLNGLGFLNGHTPFSAMLAFSSLMVAYLHGNANIALSNEASANESTVPGSTINHQYSKSFEFEADFRHYYQTYITPSINYFSYLRPLNEVQIARIFSTLPAYHSVFKSCNVGSKTDSWCGHCPKCLFVYTLLSPFLSRGNLNKIFDKELFSDISLLNYLDELTGVAKVKPFECVGTLDEVNSALSITAQIDDYKDLPLIEHYLKTRKKDLSENFQILLHSFNTEHFLSLDQVQLLKKALHV